MGGMPASATTMPDDIDSAVQALRTEHFGRDRIETSRRVVGGGSAHRVIGKAIGRQVQGALQQSSSTPNWLPTRWVCSRTRDIDRRGSTDRCSSSSTISSCGSPNSSDRSPRSINPCRGRGACSRRPGRHLVFGGSLHRVLPRRSRRHAGAVPGPGRGARRSRPGVEIGFGRGEFLELLDELGVDARGIEPSAQLVRRRTRPGGSTSRSARRRVPRGRRAGASAARDDPSDRAPPAAARHRLRAARVREGAAGRKVIVETVNPKSLCTSTRTRSGSTPITRAGASGPPRVPFRRSRFTDLRREYRSPVAADEALELLPGDDEARSC